MAHQVVLSWTVSSDPVSGYNVYRGLTASTISPTPLNSSLITGTTYTDTTVTGGDSYVYDVEAVGADGVFSVPSNQVTTVIPPATVVLSVVSIS
jgi:hypothetical protein